VDQEVALQAEVAAVRDLGLLYTCTQIFSKASDVVAVVEASSNEIWGLQTQS